MCLAATKQAAAPCDPDMFVPPTNISGRRQAPMSCHHKARTLVAPRPDSLGTPRIWLLATPTCATCQPVLAASKPQLYCNLKAGSRAGRHATTCPLPCPMCMCHTQLCSVAGNQDVLPLQSANSGCPATDPARRPKILLRAILICLRTHQLLPPHQLLLAVAQAPTRLVIARPEIGPPQHLIPKKPKNLVPHGVGKSVPPTNCLCSGSDSPKLLSSQKLELVATNCKMSSGPNCKMTAKGHGIHWWSSLATCQQQREMVSVGGQ